MFVVGALTSIFLVLAYVLHYRAKWAVAAYKRQLLEHGEKLKMEQLLPAPTPLESNGAPLFNQTTWKWNAGTNLLDKNSPLTMHMVAPGKAIVGWSQVDVSSDQTNTWAEVESALAQYASNLDLVREAAERPIFDFQLNYHEGYNLRLPHLPALKRSIQVLATAVLCDLHRGDVAAAGTNIQVILALIKATGGEHFAISQLVRIAMAHISFAATWELLQSPNLTDDELATIQRCWTDLEFMESVEQSLLLERILTQMVIEQIRNSSAQFRQLLPQLSSGPASSTFSFGPMAESILGGFAVGAMEIRWRIFLSCPDELRTLKGYQTLLESVRMVRAGKSFHAAFSRQSERLAELGLNAKNEESGFGPSGQDLRFLFSQSVLSLTRMLNRVFAVEVSRELTITVLALKRYQLRHGHYPDQLSALVPEFIGAARRDPADGQPLRYQHKPDGTFLLYSIGEDGVDNGGDASPLPRTLTQTSDFHWKSGRDLIWPSPATPQEIIAFREKKAKNRGQ